MRRYLVGGAVAAALTASLLFVVYQTYLGFAPRSGRYPVQGIDISHHQGVISWDALAAGDESPAFVYMKATEGGDFRDTQFTVNWDEAERVGIARGAYHYFTLCTPGAEQAANFIDVVPADPEALPPAVDLEFGGNCSHRPSSAELRTELTAFLDLVEDHYGKTAVLYTTASFYRAHLDGAFDDRPFWLRSLIVRPRYGREPWYFWQFHSRGRRDGVDGWVDLNAFYGSAAEFEAFRRRDVAD